jgi:hypothetical protein
MQTAETVEELMAQFDGNAVQAVIHVYEEKIGPTAQYFLDNDLKGLDHQKTKDLIQAQNDFTKLLILLLREADT